MHFINGFLEFKQRIPWIAHGILIDLKLWEFIGTFLLIHYEFLILIVQLHKFISAQTAAAKFNESTELNNRVDNTRHKIMQSRGEKIHITLIYRVTLLISLEKLIKKRQKSIEIDVGSKNFLASFFLNYAINQDFYEILLIPLIRYYL